MTERKPPDVSWASWIERQIQVGQNTGAFDDLPGSGRPIEDLDDPHDDLWWVKAKLRREDVAFTPPTIAIRADRDATVAAAMESSNELQVRDSIARLNERIARVNSHATAGPPSTVAKLDPETIVERWSNTQSPTEPSVDTRDESSTVAVRRRRFGLRRR